MNKQFTIFIGSAFIAVIIAGLCIRLNYMGAGGIFTAIASVLFIYALSWGSFSNPINVRKRNISRIAMLLAFHIIAFFVVGGSKEFVVALNTNNATKSMETISKTYSTIEALKDTGLSILKFESVNFEKILWVYIIWFIGFGISVYKVLLSWGWPCVITSVLTIASLICLCMFWTSLETPLNLAGAIVVVFLTFLSLYFGKPHLHSPAVV